MALEDDPVLYLVPTPIGNLEDITLRALKILEDVNLILAEDTRVSGKLLKHYQIKKPLQSYHAHNEHRVVTKLVHRIREAGKTALITDAGTPGISDPGFLLIRECLNHDIVVECLPGPTAFVPALVKSGIPCDRFIFEGFLPPKKGRKDRLNRLSEEERTFILYESPYRIEKTLQDLVEYLGEERSISISRELTKIYEETITGPVGEVHKRNQGKKWKGEFVIIVEGKK